MHFLKKYEICLLFLTPNVDFPPFLKVIDAPHIQRPIYMYPKSYKSMGPQIDEVVEVHEKGNKQTIYKHGRYAYMKKNFFEKSVLIWAVLL